MNTVNAPAAATTGSLLDRLSDRATDQIAEATVSRGDLQATSPQESILRNLQWLLNTTRLQSSVNLDRWPHIQRSVLNFGIPELTGQYLSSVDTAHLERQLTEAIGRFEPRLISHSLQVKALVTPTEFGQRTLTLLVTGECIESLNYSAVVIQTHVDVESGRVLNIGDPTTNRATNPTTNRATNSATNRTL